MIDAQKLIALADAATPGPWQRDGLMVHTGDRNTITHTGVCGGWLPTSQRENNAELIAALSPAVVKELAQALIDADRLRWLLFRAHGSNEHLLYGDDGEMSCGACGCDFKRDTPDVLSKKIGDYRIRGLQDDAARAALSGGKE